MATVKVVGTARVAVEPDEVLVWIRLNERHDSPDAAFASVADRLKRLDDLLDELGIPEERRTTAGVGIRPHHEYTPAGVAEPRGFFGHSQVQVRLEDAESAVNVLRLAVERVGGEVEGPGWRVSPDNPKRLEACRRAAEVARRRAQEYATTLGLSLGSVVAVVDANADEELRTRGMSFGPTLDPDAELPVHAGDLAVGAAVSVTFELVPA